MCAELKAEVEKLRAAQVSSQGIEPEKMRLFQQEIASLKTKLSQQEHEMAEAHRCVDINYKTQGYDSHYTVKKNQRKRRSQPL